MHDLWHDFRYGWRGLLSHPGFFILAVLTLALGIGAAAAIFSVIQNVLLDPFPYSDAHRVAMTNIGTLTGYLKQFSYAEPQFSLVLLGVFASVGLILVAVGVYSVIAYTVSRQTREIGIRMALGASRRDVLRMVSLMGLRLIAIGAAIGLFASFGVTRVIANQLSGISPHDPLTLIAVVAVMALVGIAACYFPAQRASRVDPMVALRVE